MLVQQLLGTLGHRCVLLQLAALGGYDASQMGEVVAPIEPHTLNQGKQDV